MASAAGDHRSDTRSGLADQFVARITHHGARLPGWRRWPRLHGRIYRSSQGRVAKRWFGTPILVLETTGRRSGRTHSTPLVYVRDGDRYVVVAANAGSQMSPAWSLNLEANPQAAVVHCGQRIGVAARKAEGPDRGRLWDELARRYSPLPVYLRFTSRPFPIWVLEPVAA